MSTELTVKQQIALLHPAPDGGGKALTDKEIAALAGTSEIYVRRIRGAIRKRDRVQGELDTLINLNAGLLSQKKPTVSMVKTFASHLMAKHRELFEAENDLADKPKMSRKEDSCKDSK